MGDDVTNIIITEPEPIEEEDTYEKLGEELLARLDTIDIKFGELYARIAELEGRNAELLAREFAAIEHEHVGFATSEHTHDGYAAIEHEHEARTPEERKPDTPPRKQHPYFRKIDEF